MPNNIEMKALWWCIMCPMIAAAPIFLRHHVITNRTLRSIDAWGQYFVFAAKYPSPGCAPTRMNQHYQCLLNRTEVQRLVQRHGVIAVHDADKYNSKTLRKAEAGVSVLLLHSQRVDTKALVERWRKRYPYHVRQNGQYSVVVLDKSWHHVRRAYSHQLRATSSLLSKASLTTARHIPMHILQDIASSNEVYWIEPYVSIRPHSRFAGAYLLNRSLVPLHVGTGELIAIGDTGLDIRHCAIGDEHPPMNTLTLEFGKVPGPSVLHMHNRKIVAYNRYVFIDDGETITTDFRDFDNGHGTHVMTTAAGTGEQCRGAAPGAKLLVMDLGFSESEDSFIYIPQDIKDHMLSWISRHTSSRIFSVSWGTDLNVYTETARQMDEHVFENSNFVIVVANGNNGDMGRGTVGTPATAKNVISVGASFNVHDAVQQYEQADVWVDEGGFPFQSTVHLDTDAVASFSSQGPTEDGRIKPDILAPGSPIVAARANHGCKNMVRHGTSMAAPLVAGMVAHLRSVLHDPSAALVKALLVSAARPPKYIVGFEEDEDTFLLAPFVTARNPDRYDYGFGVAHMPQLERLTWFEGTSIAQGETLQYHWSGAVQRGSITLVWSDPPAAPNAHMMLVNNLDLEVIVNEGTPFYGNDGDRPDAVNNVEKVTFGPLQGNMTVQVRGTNLRTPQQFALVSTVPITMGTRLQPGQCTSGRQHCAYTNGGGTQRCQDGTWGACEPQYCLEGYVWNQGHCVPRMHMHCTRACNPAHGSGMMCSDASNTAQCMLTSCYDGYVRQGNECVCVDDCDDVPDATNSAMVWVPLLIALVVCTIVVLYGVRLGSRRTAAVSVRYKTMLLPKKKRIFPTIYMHEKQ